MKKQVKTLLAALLGGGLLLGAAATGAYEAGDMVLRAGAAGVYPDTDSDQVPGIPGSGVDVDSAWSLGITFTYMATDVLGIGVLGAWPFEHDIEGDGTISALGTVADTKVLPPTVTLQYHFKTGNKFHPYVGAGFNYTYFFDEDTKGPLSALSTDLDLDDSWGLAGELGLDYEINDDWVVSGQVWYIDIDTEAKLTGPGLNTKFDVEIDPWVYMLSVGRKF